MNMPPWLYLLLRKLKKHIDLTGRFPYKSSSGNEYIYVMYDYDSNAIFDIPIKNLQAKLYLLHGKHFTIASANMATQQNIFYFGQWN